MSLYFILFAGMLATMLTRFLPFIIFSSSRSKHPNIMYLSRVLPSASMALLVVYVYRNLSLASETFNSTIIASVSVIILQLIFKNSLISMVIGTLIYMAFVQQWF